MLFMQRERPFDAVLMLAFGGPACLDDVRPFLEHVVGGKHVPPERLDEIAKHYALFDGVSPIMEMTQRQAEKLQHRLSESGIDVPVYVGMRHWHPFLTDTLCGMSRADVRCSIGFIAAAHQSEPSCLQYKQSIRDARAKLVKQGLNDIEVTYVDSWYDHDGFIAANANQIRKAIEKLDTSLREKARIVFTAHSIPVSLAKKCQYVQQIATTAKLVADKLNRGDWAVVYQSRSGRPTDCWLEPDVCDYLRTERGRGLEAVVLAPIGFVSEHIELLYDLNHEAAGVCRQLGLPMARARTANDDPAFIDMMADMVRQTWERYTHFPPLPIVGMGFV